MTERGKPRVVLRDSRAIWLDAGGAEREARQIGEGPSLPVVERKTTIPAVTPPP